MAVSYEAKEWKNDSVGNTPITAEELNRIDSGVAQVAEAVNALDEPGNVTTADIADGAVTADKLSQEVRDSVSQVTSTSSPVAVTADNGVGIEGKASIPPGFKAVGIVGIKSNHNLSVFFGRQEVSEDGSWVVFTCSVSSFSDLTVTVTILCVPDR